MNGKIFILLALASCLSAQSIDVQYAIDLTNGTETTTSDANSTQSPTTVESGQQNSTTVGGDQSTSTDGSTQNSTQSSSTSGTNETTTQSSATTGTTQTVTQSPSTAGINQTTTQPSRFPCHHGRHGPPRGPPRPPSFPIPPGIFGSRILGIPPRIADRFRSPGPPRDLRLSGRPIISGLIDGRRSFRKRRSSVSGNLNLSGRVGFPGVPSLPGLPGIPDVSKLEIPNVEDIVPTIPSLSNTSNLSIPEIPNFPRLPLIPGVRDAVEEARARVATAINAENDLLGGIQNAILVGLSSDNPTDAIRQLVSTVLNAYLTVARHCPFLVIGGYLMREGLYLAAAILVTIADISGQIQGGQ